jgi:hypothetical protein
MFLGLTKEDLKADGMARGPAILIAGHIEELKGIGKYLTFIIVHPFILHPYELSSLRLLYSYLCTLSPMLFHF